jgi:hypothetical protein
MLLSSGEKTIMIQSNDGTNQIPKDIAVTKTYHAPKMTLLGPIHGIIQAGGAGGPDGGGVADNAS